MKKRRMKTYSIIHVNCDCAAYDMPKLSRAIKRCIIGPRCELCNKVLGWMQWSVMDEVKATTEFEALKKYKKQERTEK